MNPTNVTLEKAADFYFSTIYRGNSMTFKVVSIKDRFKIMTAGKLFGHIKIGNDRHSWFVADSNYVEYELVKEIAERIIEKL